MYKQIFTDPAGIDMIRKADYFRFDPRGVIVRMSEHESPAVLCVPLWIEEEDWTTNNTAGIRYIKPIDRGFCPPGYSETDPSLAVLVLSKERNITFDL